MYRDAKVNMYIAKSKFIHLLYRNVRMDKHVHYQNERVHICIHCKNVVHTPESLSDIGTLGGEKAGTRSRSAEKKNQSM